MLGKFNGIECHPELVSGSMSFKEKMQIPKQVRDDILRLTVFTKPPQVCLNLAQRKPLWQR